jgi:hypothetical protein
VRNDGSSVKTRIKDATESPKKEGPKNPQISNGGLVNVETIHQMARFNREEINLDTFSYLLRGTRKNGLNTLERDNHE